MRVHPASFHNRWYHFISPKASLLAPALAPATALTSRCAKAPSAARLMLRTLAAASCSCACRVSLPAAARPVCLRSPAAPQPARLLVTFRSHSPRASKPRGMAAAAAPDGQAAAAAAAAGGSHDDPLLQYVVLRRDLWTELDWPLGSVVAQGCHAATAALWLTRESDDTQVYCAEANLDHMHKVRGQDCRVGLACFG